MLSQGISPLETVNGSGLKLTERYALLEQVAEGSHKRSNPGARETHWTTELSGFASITPRFTLLAVVPYRKGKTEGELVIRPDGTAVELDTGGAGSAAGVGDVTFLARYTVLSSEKPASQTRLAVLGGAKLATGRTNERTDDGGEYLDSHLQPGTGSTDLVFGLSAGRAAGPYTLSANLLGTIPTEGEFGDTKHRFGKALNYDVSGKYGVYNGDAVVRDTRFFVVLGMNGELRGKETVDGEIEENSGGNVVYLSPGLQLSLAPHWVFDITYQRAVYHDLGGTQLAETKKVIGGATYLF